MMGMIVGGVLWLVLFAPITTLVIQPRLDAFVTSAPNQYVNSIANQFKSLYYIIMAGSFIFHLIYGALLGFLAGRMTEINAFSSSKNKVEKQMGST